LMDSYEPERRPSGEMTSEQAYTRYVLRVDPSLGKDDIEEPLDDVAIELGPVYASDAVVDSSPSETPVTQNPREPGAHLGARAPHLWVRQGDRRMSTLDVFGHGFVLLAAADGQAWTDAAGRLPDSELRAYRVAPDGDLVAAEGEFETAYGIPSTGALLVRPDGVIAWRTEAVPDDPATEIDGVLQRILARREVPSAAA
ncbi:MAG TPA: hypothetical protein VFM66_06130, partial [Agromyces sp.]|nr:hypothetical protein [Agromyces sp.]